MAEKLCNLRKYGGGSGGSASMLGVKFHVIGAARQIFIPKDKIVGNSLSLTTTTGPSGYGHLYANLDGSSSGGVHITPIPSAGNTFTIDLSTLTITDGVWIYIAPSGKEYEFTFN